MHTEREQALYNALDILLTAADMVKVCNKERLSTNLVYLEECASDARKALRDFREAVKKEAEEKA